MGESNRISGDNNFQIGGDIILNLSSEDRSAILENVFLAADLKFRKEVSENGKIIRFSEEVNYSAQALFTSLIRIGLPPNAGIKIIFEIIDSLKEILEFEGTDRLITTADIRASVVNSINALAYTGKYTSQNVSILSAAYVRRYGHPENQYLKVIDNHDEVDLDYNYIKKILIPHLLNRIIELPKTKSPIEIFPEIFSSQIVDQMATEIMTSVHDLNLYSVRYKTILNMIQDIVLEPPHPWIVNKITINKILAYNVDRFQRHFQKILSFDQSNLSAVVLQVYFEFFMHSCAAILSKYGSYLGIGERYGLGELMRLLNLKKKNISLWDYCEIHNIENDLKKINMNIEMMQEYLKRTKHTLNTIPKNADDYKRLFDHAIEFNKIVESITIN